MLRLPMTRRASAFAVAAATVVATVVSLAPHGATADAPSGGRISHPQMRPVSKVASAGMDQHSTLRPGRRALVAPQPRLVQTAAASGGSVRTLNAPKDVSPATAQGVDQVQTIQGVSHDSQTPKVSPPDTNISASPTLVIEAVNLSLLYMDHSGGSQGVVLLTDLWNTLDSGIGSGSKQISDPRIVYDSVSGRWFTSIVYYDNALVPAPASTSTHSWMGVAASTDATATSWVVDSFQSAGAVLMDQPNLGLNGDKVVIGANDFDETQTDPNKQSIGAQLEVWKKSDLTGNTISSNSKWTPPGMPDCEAFGYAPAVAVSSASTEYVVFNNNPAYALPQGCGNAQPAKQEVTLLDITGVPGGSPMISPPHHITMCPSCSGQGLVTIQPSAGIPQPQTGMTVDPGDDRFLNAIWANNVLWTGSSTAVPGAVSGLSMFEVDTSGNTLPNADVISSSISESFAYPNFALDSNGVPFFSFSRGSSSRFMSSGTFAFLQGTQSVADALVLNGGAGQGPYDCHCTGGQPPTRWGDYSGSAIDPANPTTVWVATEYSAVGDGHDNNWGTLLTRVTLDPPGISSVTVNNGVTRGGTATIVIGSQFDENSVVLFGGVPAQSQTWIDSRHILAVTPPHYVGTYDVTVQTLTGSVTLPGAFTFVLPPLSHGYWLDAADGGIFPHGNATQGLGSTGNIHLNQPAVGMAAMPDGGGYWIVCADGGIFPFGDATQGLGSTGNIRLNKPIVGMATTSDGKGYWLVASDGGIFPFGDAGGYGSTGNIRLNQPVVGMAPTPTGHGYWLVASDGGIFPFGDAVGRGSTGNIHLNQPIVGMAQSGDDGGYWLVASDGGLFPFGDATQGLGSEGGVHLNQPMVGMAATAN